MLRFLTALTLILLAAAPANAEWRRAVSPHFIVYSEGPPEEIREFTETLERFDALLKLMSPIAAEESPVPLTVFVVSQGSRIASLVGNAFVLGFYEAEMEGPMAVVPRRMRGEMSAEEVLFHEYAHHFMLKNYSTSYPGWFVEGYAELFSTTSFERNGSIRLGLPPAHRRHELWDRDAIPIRTLLLGSPRDVANYGSFSFYAQSWFITHYLTFDQEREGQLARYLALIGSGRPAQEAAVETFGDLETLERDFERYRRARSLPIITIRPENLPPLPQIRVESLPRGEQALVWHKLRYMRGVRPADVADFAQEVRAIAAAMPSEPAALQMLADAEYLAENFDAADRAVDALLAIRPDAPRALLRKGLIAIRRLETAENSEPDRWTEARRWIVRANRAAPDDPLILYRYYASFARQRIRPPDAARLGLARAFQLMPQVAELRMNLALSLVSERRYNEAEPLLASLAYAPHASPLRQAALEMLEKVQPLEDGAPMPAGEAQGSEVAAPVDGDAE